MSTQPLPDPEEPLLLAALRAGDARAFERLVQREQQACWRLLMRLTRDAALAEDLCQETFLRVYQRLQQFRGDSRLSTWILRIAWTIGMRHLERQRPETRVDADAIESLQAEPDEAEGPLEQLAATELAVLIEQALNELPPLPRSLLTLYYKDEQSIAEIGAITGLAEGTIKSHLFRARQNLRARWQAAYGDQQ